MADSGSEFGHVTMFLTLVTYITDTFYSHRDKPFQASSAATVTLNDAQRQRLHILHAFHDLLVRRRAEAFATTACKSFGSSLSELASCSSESYTLFAMAEEYSFGSDLVDPLGLHKPTAAIDSPDGNFSPPGANPGEVVCISGQSYWSSILQDPWQFLDNQAGTRSGSIP